jgi:hypothetical protein
MKITKNTLARVYKSKAMSIETMELKGYKLIDNLFVDSSGFGMPGEPAYTQSGFEKKMTELLDKHGEVYTTITGQGMFQVYVGVFKKIGKKLSKRVGNNTYEIYDEEGNRIAIRLHDTNIMTFEGNEIILDSGGWQTRVTKDRMNDYLPSVGYHIEQKNYEWTLVHGDERIPFKDGIRIKI